jgi:tetratricopeptide (TPR) repeat protein
VARASAFWNACIFEAGRGSVGDAVPLAQRALALFSEGQDGRNLAILRTNLGDLQLQLSPPQIEEAKLNLEQAAEEMRSNSAGPVDMGRNELARARAHYLAGELDVAEVMTGNVLERVRTLSPLTAADAKSLEGQVHAARGDIAAAAAAYREAVFILTGVGSDRTAAEMWFELAGLLEDVNEFDAARDAYRSAAASTGIAARPRVKASKTIGAELLS